MEQMMWGMKAKLKREADERKSKFIENKPVEKKVEQKKSPVDKIIKYATIKKFKPKEKEPTYKAKDKEEDIHKKVFNQKIADYVRTNQSFKKKTAIVLDAETMLTFKALVSAGYNPKQIQEINYCKKTYELIKKVHNNTFYTSLGEHIKSTPKYSLTTVVADYMCSVVGNADVRPLDEVKFMFENKLFAKGSLLAITLSWRAGPNVPSNYGSLMKLLNVLTIGANRNDYKLVVTPDGQSYNNGGSMFYLICHLW